MFSEEKHFRVERGDNKPLYPENDKEVDKGGEAGSDWRHFRCLKCLSGQYAISRLY